FSAKVGGNTFYLGLQKVMGDDEWFRVNGASGGPLANDAFGSSFENAKERSWQLRHDFDFAALGVPGLTLMNRYIHGDNVHNSSTDDGTEWARESELAYTVQSGPLKTLNVKWRNSSMRRDWGRTNSFDENRLIVSYPLNLL
ncbi:outer membrane porin, OprD family, partial [Pseudomonas delhiensis]